MSYFRKCMKFVADEGTIVGPGRFEELFVVKKCVHGLEGHVDFWTPSSEDMHAMLQRDPQSMTEITLQGRKIR